MLNGIRNRLARSVAVCCAASLALLVSAAPAFASPDHTRVFVSGSVFVGRGGGGYRPGCAPAPVPYRPTVVVHGDDCNCAACFAKHEYARGVQRGETRGQSAGYREGVTGQRFCDAPRDELCDNSRPYQDGYLAAFSKTYHCAYEQGRQDRMRACQPVYQPTYRPRCAW